jgi:hypothetical protein
MFFSSDRSGAMTVRTLENILVASLSAVPVIICRKRILLPSSSAKPERYVAGVKALPEAGM